MERDNFVPRIVVILYAPYAWDNFVTFFRTICARSEHELSLKMFQICPKQMVCTKSQQLLGKNCPFPFRVWEPPSKLGGLQPAPSAHHFVRLWYFWGCCTAPAKFWGLRHATPAPYFLRPCCKWTGPICFLPTADWSTMTFACWSSE